MHVKYSDISEVHSMGRICIVRGKGVSYMWIDHVMYMDVSCHTYDACEVV